MHITHNLPRQKTHFLLFFGQFLISHTAIFSIVLQIFYHLPANQSIKNIREHMGTRTRHENIPQPDDFYSKKNIVYSKMCNAMVPA